MRAWLDATQYDVSKFRYYEDQETFAICVDFSKAEEAEDFKKRFGGEDKTFQTSSPILVSDFTGTKEHSMSETMAQVCWWRLMAEELRTEAEELSSADAQEMMFCAAFTYERMAEDLEQRLGKAPCKAGRGGHLFIG